MHYRLLVTFNKDYAGTSEEARAYADTTLANDDSFVGDGGRFGSPVADWFVIGGRWSGELSRETWAKDIEKKVKELEKKEGVEILGVHYGKGNPDGKKQATLKETVERFYKEALPEAYRGKGLEYDRDTYSNRGYEDDAMLVNEELYNALLKSYAGKEKGVTKQTSGLDPDYTWEDLHFIDLDYDPASKDFIGKKWVVVVDYHS